MSDKFWNQELGVMDFAALMRENAKNAQRKLGPQAGIVVGGQMPKAQGRRTDLLPGWKEVVVSPGVISPQQTRTFGFVSDASGGFVRASTAEGQALQRGKSKSLSDMLKENMTYKALLEGTQ